MNMTSTARRLVQLFSLLWEYLGGRRFVQLLHRFLKRGKLEQGPDDGGPIMRSTLPDTSQTTLPMLASESFPKRSSTTLVSYPPPSQASSSMQSFVGKKVPIEISPSLRLRYRYPDEFNV